MTPEQKQRAKDALKNWLADEMGDLLQEMVDAPEVEPFAVIHLDGSFVHVEFKQPIAGTGKFEVYAAPPAPSVPDVARDAERYRWLRTHGLQRAWVSLGTDFEGDNFASFRCEFNLPEPPNLPYEDDEGLPWADKDFDAAIDAAIKRQGGE